MTPRAFNRAIRFASALALAFAATDVPAAAPVSEVGEASAAPAASAPMPPPSIPAVPPDAGAPMAEAAALVVPAPLEIGELRPEATLPGSLAAAWSQAWSAWHGGSTAETEFKEFLLQAQNMGLRNLDAAAAAMIIESQVARAAADSARALAAARQAEALAPDLPAAKLNLGSLLIRFQPADVRGIVTAYVAGVLAFGVDFWSALAALANGALIATLALAFAFTVFAVVAALRHGPALAHRIAERTGRIAYPPIAWAVATALLLAPVVAGAPVGWWFAWIVLLLWFQLNWRERVIGVVGLALLATLTLWLPALHRVRSAATAPDIALMAKVARGEPNVQIYFDTLAPALPQAAASDWRLNFTRAVHERNTGQLQQAEHHFQAALEQAPDLPILLNSLGNLRFIQKDFDSAIAFYRAALQRDSKYVPAHYNLAQALREKLQFEEGQKHFQEAETLAPLRVQAFARRSVGPLETRVVDDGLERGAVWRRLLRIDPADRAAAQTWAAALFGAAADRAPLALGGEAALLVVAGLALPGRRFARACGICGRYVCGACQRRTGTATVCERCYHRQRRSGRGAEILQSDARTERLARVARLLSVVPGAGHFYLQLSLRGLVATTASGAVLLALLARPLWIAPPHVGWLGAPGPSPWLIAPVALLLYAWAFWDIARFELTGVGN